MQLYNFILKIYLSFKKITLFLPRIVPIMIQRIQTVYLFITVLISALALFFVPIWDKMKSNLYDPLYVDYGFTAIAVITLISIFLFKNRKRQMLMVRFVIFLNIILLGFFVYWFLNMPGEMNFSEKGIGMGVPIVSIVFLLLAHKAIKKDDDLVKSVDRLR